MPGLTSVLKWKVIVVEMQLTVPRRMTSIVSTLRRISKRISRGMVARVAICEGFGAWGWEEWGSFWMAVAVPMASGLATENRFTIR